MKLAKLPERKRARLICQVSLDLQVRLKNYADLYETTYGARENIEALLPYMIEAFLDADKSTAAKQPKHVGKSTLKPEPDIT